ncbi:hypothetical protein ACI8AC_00160 [Geodermatophilus sp. SYSU D00758]
MPFAGRPVEADVSPGAWLCGPLAGQAGTVAALLPAGFEAHARVLHPAVRYAGDDDVEVRWSTVAAANGRVAHPGMQWAAVTGAWDYVSADSQPPLWDAAPADGHLPEPVAVRLAAVLARHTTTPDDCFFGLWHGFGFVTAAAPTLVLPHREYWLVRGPVGTAAANLADEPSEQSANLWWPADRAWCVATDIDLMSTYVAAGARCVAELLDDDVLEVVPAAPGDPVGPDSDAVNPPPA